MVGTKLNILVGGVFLLCTCAIAKSPPFQCGVQKFKCKSDKCIPMSYKCDKMDDCGDNSDEEDCPIATCNPERDFKCVSDNRCLPVRWRCDGEFDCPDKSDEANCPKPTCPPDYFQCNNTRCIPNRWVCDMVDDCGDNSDEAECSEKKAKTCPTYQFACKDGVSCVSKVWRCDGDTDCPDGSDEHDCKTSGNKTCASGEFSCGKQCIPTRWRCDGNEDCHNGADEKNCKTLPSPTTCSVGHWKCGNGDCISASWKCDGDFDCSDRSDEKSCDSITCSARKFACKDGKQCVFNAYRCNGIKNCDDGSDEEGCVTPTPTCRSNHFNCSDGTCIDSKKVCDQKNDCPKGEDEPVNCYINECTINNGHCMHNCRDLNIGYECSCLPGYKLQLDHRTCEDVDECQLHGLCHQKCVNEKGSFKCSCADGFMLEPDGRTCKVKGMVPKLYFSNRQDIRTLTLDNFDYAIAVQQLKGVISFDFHMEKEYIYMADAIDETIKRTRLENNSTVETILKHVHTPDGLAVDWVTGKLYWTDTGYKTIEIADMDGKHNADLVQVDLAEPRAIALDPEEGYIYWTDWGDKTSGIEKISMDGAIDTRKKLITTGIKWPNGLTLDLVQRRMYWIDAKLRRLEVADLDGNNRMLLKNLGIAHPFALDNFNDRLYWTDWRLDGIRSVEKFNSSQISTLKGQLIAPMGIKIYHPSRQPKEDNPCGTNNNGCSHLCLLGNRNNKRIVSCFCPRNMTLQKDGKKCVGVHSTRGPPSVPTTLQTKTRPPTTQSTKEKVVTTLKPTKPSTATKTTVKTVIPTKLTTQKPMTPDVLKTTHLIEPFITTKTTVSTDKSTHPLTRTSKVQPTVGVAAQVKDQKKGIGAGVIAAISVTIIIAALFLIICIVYWRRRNLGKGHVMYYKDMSTTPLEEDFDLQTDNFSEKAKIIDEEA